MSDWKCPNLKIISICQCNVETIGNLVLPKLEEIYLDSNPIKDISPMSEWNCQELKRIDLSSCEIIKFGSLDLPALEEINLA